MTDRTVWLDDDLSITLILSEDALLSLDEDDELDDEDWDEDDWDEDDDEDDWDDDEWDEWDEDDDEDPPSSRPSGPDWD